VSVRRSESGMIGRLHDISFDENSIVK